MRFWAKCFNPNVLSQLFISDRGLRTGPSVVRGKDPTADPAEKPANTSVVNPIHTPLLWQNLSVLWQ